MEVKAEQLTCCGRQTQGWTQLIMHALTYGMSHHDDRGMVFHLCLRPLFRDAYLLARVLQQTVKPGLRSNTAATSSQ